MTEIVRDIFKELTEEWIETFSKPEFQNGFMWVMAGSGFLPKGVNHSDERVIKLCQQAKEYYESIKANKNDTQ